MQRVLIVCVGNICRSPMAEGLLRAAAGEFLTVSSAGLAALVGRPAEPEAVALMDSRGVDISGHRARQLDETLLREHDLVLAMEMAHVRDIESRWPFACGRTFRWGHWGDFDVDDPFKRGSGAFSRALADIERGLPDWQARIIPEHRYASDTE